MAHYKIDLKDIRKYADLLHAGDTAELSGTVFTSRDAAHKRIFSLLDEGGELPYELEGACIYYAGPTPTPPGKVVGSIGPTTSGRMDPYAPRLLDLGLAAMVGKGERNEAVCQAIVRNKGVYFCAIGGAGALCSEHITSLEEIAFKDLGCESVKRLTFENFPVIVAIAPDGSNIFKRAE